MPHFSYYRGRIHIIRAVPESAGRDRMVGRREMAPAAFKAVWFLTKPLLDEVGEDKAVVP